MNHMISKWYFNDLYSGEDSFVVMEQISFGGDFSIKSNGPKCYFWVFILANCAAITELVLNETNAYQVVQVGRFYSVK